MVPEPDNRLVVDRLFSDDCEEVLLALLNFELAVPSICPSNDLMEPMLEVETKPLLLVIAEETIGGFFAI